MRLLILNDDVRDSQILMEFFQRNHWGVDIVYSCDEFEKYASSGIYDAIVLERNLQNASELDVLEKLRTAKNYVPVIILANSSTVDDVVQALDRGADDYLTRPFELQELLARVNAITRRKGVFKNTILSFGDFCLNKDSCEIFNSSTKNSLKISLKELSILLLLFENPSQIVKKKYIIEKIWGKNSDAEYNNVEVYISFIRKKMEHLDVHVNIRTARGIGYSLTELSF